MARILILLLLLVSCESAESLDLDSDGATSVKLVPVAPADAKESKPWLLGGLFQSDLVRSPLSMPEVLSNTEYAEEDPPAAGTERARMQLGLCEEHGWSNAVRMTLYAVPSCVEEWRWPVRAIVVVPVYLRGRRGRQVGAVEIGDVVLVRELDVRAPLFGSVLLDAVVDVPRKRVWPDGRRVLLAESRRESGRSQRK